MRKTILIVLASFFCMPLFAQISYDEISSSKLNAVRQLKIKLPKDYDPSSEIKYPLIIVFEFFNFFGA